MNFDDFKELVKNLKSRGFYCLNTGNVKDMYSYLTEDKVAIRFAYVNQVIPNMEFKFSKTKIDDIVLKETLEVHLNKKIIKISNLELQIAFKEKILGSPKDIEDARHIRNTFKISNCLNPDSLL